MSASPGGLYQFEGFELDRARWTLRYREQVLPLNRKTFDLLLCLVENADRVVTKEELLRDLWPAQFVEESNLTQQIFLLRRALGRCSDARIIETVSGRGYRFAVPVQFIAAPVTKPFEAEKEAAGQTADAVAPAPRPPLSLTQHARPTTPTARWLAASLLALAVFGALWFARRGGDHVSIASYTQLTHDGHAKFLGGTDGTRLYFTRLSQGTLAQMTVSGKTEAPMPLALQDPWSGTVSPDGSTLLVLSQASGQGPGASLWALQLVDGSLRRLANAVTAAWSPGGERIVYASADGDLFTMRRDGSAVHRIATLGGNISAIAWSPDGRLLRFARDGLLWQTTPTGAAISQVLPRWGITPSQGSGTWASNGDFFFVADGQIWMLTNSRPLSKSAPHPVQLTYGPMAWDRPVATRDGKTLFASGRTNRGELVRFAAGSTIPKRFLGGISAEFVSFSQAANAVAYVSYPDGVLWRANSDGSHPRQLTEAPLYPKSICWSPDGTHLAFVDRSGDRASAIFLLPADGTGPPQPLIVNDPLPETDPSWSPDGRKVAFATAPNVGASGHSDLRVFDLATGATSVLPGSEGLLVPRWSPDGRFIAAMTLDAKGMKLLKLATGQWSSLLTGAVAFPEWSADSQWINYVRWTAGSALLRIRVADGNQEVLADLAGERYTGVYTLWMGLDATGTPLMLRDAGTDDIYALALHRE